MADIDFDLTYKDDDGYGSILVDEYGDSVIYNYTTHDYITITKTQSPKLVKFISDFIKDDGCLILEKQVVLRYVLNKYKRYFDNGVIVDISKKDIFRCEEDVELHIDRNEICTSWMLYYQFKLHVVEMPEIPNGIKLLLNNIDHSTQLSQQELENVTHISVISNIKSETLA